MKLKINGKVVDLGSNYQQMIFNHKNDPSVRFYYESENERLRLSCAAVLKFSSIKELSKGNKPKPTNRPVPPTNKPTQKVDSKEEKSEKSDKK
jgi:hypothetical protein